MTFWIRSRPRQENETVCWGEMTRVESLQPVSMTVTLMLAGMKLHFKRPRFDFC
jgi:hypothetical protein